MFSLKNLTAGSMFAEGFKNDIKLYYILPLNANNNAIYSVNFIGFRRSSVI